LRSGGARGGFISLAVFMRSLMPVVTVNFALITGAAVRKFR
jgi:hypothetical protein